MTIPAKTLTTLEYDKVIARLASHTQTPAGRTLALALEPSPDYREVLRRQRLTAEARRLLEMKPGTGLGGTKDIATLVQQAGLGHTMEPQELLDVQATLSVSRVAGETITRLRAYLPFLAEIADGIGDFRDLTAAIGRSISGTGEVLDSASPVLAQLRRESRIAHDRLTTRLNQLVGSAKTAIQEPIVTLRDGRYVIPIKAEMRSQMPGIVHDVSSSGATVFLEPLETVEMGNKWRELLAEEEREIARILRDLSAHVGRLAREIQDAIDALARIDLSLAKAKLGKAMGADELPHDPPDAGSVTGPDQRWLLPAPDSLMLVNARHPLLSGDVVPITVWLGDIDPRAEGLPPPAMEAKAFRALLITGPNTGGKTIALKTVGLLALMAQAGLPIPAAENSRLPVFDAVFADIGDEQSIEQSLSTFSSHVGNIIGILGAATGRSLVLLDELGAGTDPVEGSALAKAILVHLLDAGAMTIATTHHGELKAFAHTTDGIANASVEFDLDTLSPTYRLHIGLPGQSNALSIAQRLGMPEDVLEEARSGIDPDRLAVESLISHLHKERELAETASAEQKAAAREAEKARAQVTKELQSLQANRDRLVERTREELDRELQGARSQLRDAIKEMERAQRLSVFQRTQVIEEAKAAVETVEEAKKRVEKKRRRRPRAKLPAIEPGARIFLVDVPTPGEALTEPDEAGDLDVKLGALRARINVRQVERVEKAEPVAEPPAYRKPVSLLPSAIKPELDLRGLTVDEALSLIDQGLDEAARSGVSEMRIIHGKGTGTLRRAVREMLRKHALVSAQSSAEPRDGGDGVTLVELVH